MKVIPLAAVSLFTVTCVWAAGNSPPPPPLTFEQLDVDSDGYISQKEAMARKDLSENWKIADKNGDGKIDSAEFIAYVGKERYEPPEDTMERGIGAAPTP